MPDYQQSKIYKLWSPQNDMIYIGSTTQSLSKRFWCHKSLKNKCNSKLLFEASDDVRIELIEEYSCDNKMQLLKKEGEHIRANNCINKHIAGRTSQEYREDNKEKKLEYNKQYRKDNKEKLKENQKQFYQDNKEKIKEYYQENKEKTKEYYHDNKERITERQKNYDQDNKEKIKEYQKQYREKITKL